MKKLSKNITYWLGVVAVGLMVGISIQFVRAWTEPSTTPPGGNVGAPINTSNFGQSKAGGLILNTGGAVNGLIVQNGNVGIGMTNPTQKLDINGNARATDFCTTSGKCLSGSVSNNIVYTKSAAWTFNCDNTVRTAGYVGCPSGTYVVGCARDNSNNMGGDDDWVTDKVGMFDSRDTAAWYNSSLIPPGSSGYNWDQVYPNGGCRAGYKCSIFITSDAQYIRAMCVPASGATVQ